jgi:hypothetical protein
MVHVPLAYVARVCVSRAIHASVECTIIIPHCNTHRFSTHDATTHRTQSPPSKNSKHLNLLFIPAADPCTKVENKVQWHRSHATRIHRHPEHTRRTELIKLSKHTHTHSAHTHISHPPTRPQHHSRVTEWRY